MVGLQFPCSLGKHIETVGNPAMVHTSGLTHLRPEGTRQGQGLVYTVGNIVNVTLDAIRGELVVDFVGCDWWPGTRNFWDREEIVEFYDHPGLLELESDLGSSSRSDGQSSRWCIPESFRRLAMHVQYC